MFKEREYNNKNWGNREYKDLLNIVKRSLKIQYPYYIFMINFQTITISTCNRNSSEAGKGWIRSKYLEPFSIF
jgi:hypothetical protein